MCLVDDAQWLDRASAQALAFVARRLVAESVGAGLRGARARRRARAGRAAGAAWSTGLSDADARALLDSVDHRPAGRAGARPDRRRDARQPAGAAGAAARADAGGAGGRVRAARARSRSSGRIEESFRRRLAALPADDPAAAAGRGGRAGRRRRRCVAGGRAARDRRRRGGAGGGGRAGRARRAGAVPPSAGALGGLPGGVAGGAAERAPRAGRGDRPGARSRSPRLAPRPRRRRARRGGRRRARALGRPGAGARRPGRGGRVPGARGRADPRPGARGPSARWPRRRPSTQAGAPDAALELLAMAEAGPLDELQRARVDLLRAQIAFASSRGSDAPPLLLEAARRLEPLDPALARETYLDALSAALFAGRLGRRRRAARGRRRPRAPRRRRRASRARLDLLLDGLALLITDGYAAGAPTAEAGAARVPRRGRPGRGRRCAGSGSPATSRTTCGTTRAGTRSPTAHVAARPRGRRARACSRSPSPRASALHLFAGELAAAASLVEEVGRGHRGDRQPARRLHRARARRLAGPRGRGPALIEAGISDVDRARRGHGADRRRVGRAVLYNGLGRYEEALAAAAARLRAPDGARLRRPGRCAELDRGGRPERAARRARPARCERLAETHARQRHRLGARASRPARARC